MEEVTAYVTCCGCVTAWKLPGEPLSTEAEALDRFQFTLNPFSYFGPIMYPWFGFPHSEMGTITLAKGVVELSEANREAWGLSRVRTQLHRPVRASSRGRGYPRLTSPTLRNLAARGEGQPGAAN